MKKQFTLSVSSPCSEQWNTFLPTTTGAFCLSCNRQVIDFTKMKEKDIIGFFEKQTSGICGRFQVDQLKTYKEKAMPVFSPGWNLFRTGFIGIALMIASQQVVAFNPPIKSSMEIVLENRNTLDDPIQDENISLFGQVTDENNAPFPAVNVYLKNNSTIGTLSDENGNFQLTGNIRQGDVVVFSFMGYEEVEFKVTQDFSGPLAISLSEYHMIMGKVQVDAPYQKNGSQVSQLWQKVKGIF